MKTNILYIDSDHAKIFYLIPGKVDLFKAVKHEHKSHNPPKFNSEHEERFFHEVASHLKDTKELLILGPGLAKTRFETHLKTHHHNDLAKSVVGVETIDHPTDGQLLEIGRIFFKSYDSIYNPIG